MWVNPIQTTNDAEVKGVPNMTEKITLDEDYYEELKERLHKAESLLQQYNNKASCCGQFMKDITVQKLWEDRKSVV